MRKTIAFPLIGLALFLFFWMNLPKTISDRLRSGFATMFRHEKKGNGANDLVAIQLENQNLRAKISHAYDCFLFNQRMEDQFEFLKGARDFSKKRMVHLRDRLQDQLLSLPAEVTYRDPSSWSSSIWVNVGEDDNHAIGRTIVAKNSPVLADGAIVGVVDYVGKKQARIRLITDSGLSPSVRVCRGASQNREIARQIEGLLGQVEKRADLFTTDAERGEFISKLRDLKGRCGTNWDDGYLAKGEIHGTSAPFWRSRNPVLKGVGFNFDYPDADGASRDGKVPILKEGDLLVTSGLDGVFPPGIRVGTVTSITPPKEGSYAYDIEVRPSADHLNDLETVFILPSLSE